jgi:hypothetical protein
MRRRWKAAVTARKREEAEVRQAAYDALTPQQKYDRTVERSFDGFGASRRETQRLLDQFPLRIKT